MLALVLSLNLPAAQAWAAPLRRVLILHSYHQGLPWTDSVTRGIQSAFAPFDRQIELYFDYLDAERQPKPVSKISQVAYYRARIIQGAYDALIVSDEEALGLVQAIGNNGES